MISQVFRHPLPLKDSCGGTQFIFVFCAAGWRSGSFAPVPPWSETDKAGRSSSPLSRCSCRGTFQTRPLPLLNILIVVAYICMLMRYYKCIHLKKKMEWMNLLAIALLMLDCSNKILRITIHLSQWLSSTFIETSACKWGCMLHLLFSLVKGWWFGNLSWDAELNIKKNKKQEFLDKHLIQKICNSVIMNIITSNFFLTYPLDTYIQQLNLIFN